MDKSQVCLFHINWFKKKREGAEHCGREVSTPTSHSLRSTFKSLHGDCQMYLVVFLFLHINDKMLPQIRSPLPTRNFKFAIPYARRGITLRPDASINESNIIKDRNVNRISLHVYVGPVVSLLWEGHTEFRGDRGSTVVKVLCYNSEGGWFDPSWCQWIFHWHKILPIALWALGSTQPLTEMSTRSISWG